MPATFLPEIRSCARRKILASLRVSETLLTKHQKLLETASGKRLIQLLLYQAHDQGPEGETNREKYFGALTSSAGRKGTFSSFAESFL